MKKKEMKRRIESLERQVMRLEMALDMPAGARCGWRPPVYQPILPGKWKCRVPQLSQKLADDLKVRLTETEVT